VVVNINAAPNVLILADLINGRSMDGSPPVSRQGREKGKEDEQWSWWSSRATTDTGLMGDTRPTGYEQKRAKYAALANAVRAFRRQSLHATAVTISSMGIIDPKSLNELRTIMACNNRELEKLGGQMPQAATTGSSKIGREFVQNMERRPAVDREEATVIHRNG
jgi:hypothetical protein